MKIDKDVIDMDRETHIVEGFSICVQKKPSFREWIEKKESWTKFSQLKPPDKEKLFLRWKWGLCSDAGNQELEYTRKQTLKTLNQNDLQDPPETPQAYYWNLIIKFEKMCEEVKNEIGLGVRIYTPEERKIRNIFESEEE